MSKGSRNRVTDVKRFRKNYDHIFRKRKRKGKTDAKR